MMEMSSSLPLSQITAEGSFDYFMTSHSWLRPLFSQCFKNGSASLHDKVYRLNISCFPNRIRTTPSCNLESLSSSKCTWRTHVSYDGKRNASCVHRCFWMSTRSSSEPSLYIISNVVSDLGTSVMFVSWPVFVGLHWWRWEGHWKSSCVGEPSGSTWVNEWKLRFKATWQILRGNGFCPMRRVRRKHFLKEQPRSLALKKMSSVYSEDTWQL